MVRGRVQLVGAMAKPDTATKMDVDKPAKQEGSRGYDLPWVRIVWLQQP